MKLKSMMLASAVAVVAASPYTMMLERPTTSATIWMTTYAKYKAPAVRAVRMRVVFMVLLLGA